MKKQYFIQIGGGLASALFLIVGFQFFSIDPKKHLEYQKQILEQREIISALNEDIIRIRYQTLSSYDSLVMYVKSARVNLDKLCILPTFVSREKKQILASILDQKIALFEEQQDRIERFKTTNSLLKNSLRYLPELKAEIIDRLSESQVSSNPSQYRFQTILIENLEQVLQNISLYNLTSERKISLQIEEELRQISQLKTQYNFRELNALIDLAIAHNRAIVIYQIELNELTENILATS